jgi:hypothetical protein
MTTAVISRERLCCWMRTQAAPLASLVLAACVQPAEPVILSEFMAANTRTLADERRSFEDWIELRNTGSNAVDLPGGRSPPSQTVHVNGSFPPSLCQRFSSSNRLPFPSSAV